MPKPKGGRGHKAPYQTKLMRIPVPLEQQVNQLVELYQDYLDSDEEVDVDNPPQLLSTQQNDFTHLYQSLTKLVNKIGQPKYKPNSFSEGIKDILQLITQFEPVNKS